MYATSATCAQARFEAGSRGAHVQNLEIRTYATYAEASFDKGFGPMVHLLKPIKAEKPTSTMCQIVDTERDCYIQRTNGRTWRCRKSMIR